MNIVGASDKLGRWMEPSNFWVRPVSGHGLDVIPFLSRFFCLSFYSSQPLAQGRGTSLTERFQKNPIHA